MLVNISLVVVFGIAVVFMVRSRALGIGGAVIATLFGIYLDHTSAAAPITHGVTSFIHILNSLH